MVTINIKQVDAFTDRAFGGNPAGVVLEANSLSDAEMQSIANEMNLSETAYILPSDKADLRIRWFTTEREVLFCGHATVASFHALAEAGLYGMGGDGEYSFKIETLVGILSVKVIKSADSIEVHLGSPEINLIKEDIDIGRLVTALGLSKSDLLDACPIMREGKVDYIYVPVKDLATLKQVKNNYSDLKVLGEEYKIKGYVILSTETFDQDSHVHSRFFSPYYDVIEDPVTGSANGPLAAYLAINNLITVSGDSVIVNAEQGDIIARPGRLKIELSKNGDTYQAVLIGQAVTVLNAEMNF